MNQITQIYLSMKRIILKKQYICKIKFIKMKKIVLVFIIGLIISSCGKDKKKEVENVQNVRNDNFSLVVDAIYEKDDSIAVFHAVNNNFIYDKPTVVKVKGSAQIQRITFNIPEGVAAENFTFVASTNKDQNYLTIKNISVKNNDSLIVDGDNFKYTNFFNADQSFTWDAKLLRSNIVHTNEYPPACVGSEELIGTLAK